MTIPIKSLATAVVTCTWVLSGAAYAAEANEAAPQSDVAIELAMADEDRLYDPFGVIKDGEIEPPKEPEIIKPIRGPKEAVQSTPFQDLVDRHVRIRAINAARGQVYIGMRPYQQGDTVTIKTGGAPLNCKILSVDSGGIVLQDVTSEEKATARHGR
ncbi:hypothetical protein [Sulfuriroseicoccus oceanibius]|uniref:Uncharacterized protein n=1 Tax=Sulfuriroseicoccus oceanibius TaxID=2707525 RepID=A0A6B3LC00_9BACT|nr:hypothetical protein [Sulfuriroseicoccus oceanibius]QQL44483.1 hypothetical protein G3M56_011415 [Sulfuriroseicoccus oceanibius]